MIFEQVFREGKTLRNSFFIIKYMPVSEGGQGKIGIVIPAKIVSSAVVRNRWKRKIKGLITANNISTGRNDCIVIAQAPIMTASRESIQEHILSLWQKIPSTRYS